jgi:Family of unknown function (DUF6165)
MIVLAPISVGELIDKITILQIKQIKITDEAKLENVRRELGELLAIFDTLTIPDVTESTDQLRQVNTELWDIEDGKRACEKSQTFGDDFVQLARQVYIKNDLRARLKRDINQICGSTIVEEKSYK